MNLRGKGGALGAFAMTYKKYDHINNKKNKYK